MKKGFLYFGLGAIDSRIKKLDGDCAGLWGKIGAQKSGPVCKGVDTEKVFLVVIFDCQIKELFEKIAEKQEVCKKVKEAYNMLVANKESML